ncbi:hypothetical protein CK500_09265 [Halorubrum salipaludis]|uniref:DUF8080 domain-containing protein n=1 Tax=Halorubrum salipaludis TaxID=2032630 RepID=A0A2A2FFR9_9EURY|nr:hypothetical protein [Halorubrum salipaludis]PAU83690.1 hypothetical protein CK500_09265 [Halorubrum salipaludis]
MDFAWDVDREGDVSLVRCRVRNDDAVPRRVRVESRLDAPVLPPRRGGVPEDGWDESGATLRLDPGERRALGFAARAPPTEPPVEIAEVAAVDPTERSGDTDPGEGDESTASATAAALRRLGDHRPPRDAVADGSDRLADADPVVATGSAGDGGGEPEPGPAVADGAEPEPDPTAPAPPGATTEWFDAVDARLNAVEERIDRAERLTDADLATATEAVAEADGVDGLSGLDESVAADADRLRELSDRASALAARAEATDAPIEALEQLA